MYLLLLMVFISGCIQAEVVDTEKTVDVSIISTVQEKMNYTKGKNITDNLTVKLNGNNGEIIPQKTPNKTSRIRIEDIPECPDSLMDCSDGSVAKCKNTFLDGSCTLCKPDCQSIEVALIPTSTPEPTPTKEPSINHIIFTEVFYDTPGKESEEEFVEIYNPTLNPVNLSKWSIKDNAVSWSFPGIIIEPGSYIRIARDSSGFQNLFGCAPDIGTFTRGLNNNGDQLFLKQNGEEVDFVAWEGGYEGEYPEWTLEAVEKSLARSEDTNSPDDWVLEDPTPC